MFIGRNNWKGGDLDYKCYEIKINCLKKSPKNIDDRGLYTSVKGIPLTPNKKE